MLTMEQEPGPAGSVVCRAVGELDAFTVQGFRDALKAQAATDKLVIDLSSVPFVDSAGLGALIGGIRRIHENHRHVVVQCDRSALVRLLVATGIDRVVTIVGSRDEAAEAFCGHQSGPAPGGEAIRP
ncbi:STAS domain-containing protein [Acidiferrimicrobium sp. IK]|uniref:STAS domain-containing protein n=1 Tax=Acidiferrimicrobium sp. IK TaxID=2871700 RepID=UPI0021CB5D0E|nr:STAS domain-containing protein [Acidiferrimicrobium sp. IK]MCU4184459.1 STAS domain-containing protein [Acidiferrimicrobium sp. IK]